MERHSHGGINRQQIANLTTENEKRFSEKHAKQMESLGYTA
jgi:hypothetical protein